MSASITTAEYKQQNFAQRLKDETAARHAGAEHSGFMTELLGGRLSRENYVQLLSQYTYIYGALEEVAYHFRKNPHPITEPFILEGLDRLPSISADLDALGETNLRPALFATQEYAQRIRSIAQSPERFLAHHYLRYLGDLSGGQAVAALVARHYGIGSEALSMYRFDKLPKPKIFKDSYRELLNAAPMSEQQRQNMIDEALLGFDLNARLFAELGEAAVRG